MRKNNRLSPGDSDENQAVPAMVLPLSGFCFYDHETAVMECAASFTLFIFQFCDSLTVVYGHFSALNHRAAYKCKCRCN